MLTKNIAEFGKIGKMYVWKNTILDLFLTLDPYKKLTVQFQVCLPCYIKSIS